MLLAFTLTAGAGGATAYALYSRIDANITAVDLSPLLGPDRPTRNGKGTNIALIGSDTRSGSNSSYGTGLTGAQSDSLLVLHLSENRDWATVVSFPRDSWVRIPSCELGGGKTSKPQSGKINKAYALGNSAGGAAGGAACAIKTLEHNTGLYIDHYIDVDFSGFKEVVDAVGGVRMCLPEAVNDIKARVSLPAGCQSMDGESALGYARARYSLGDGSDIGRISRQQQLMRALVGAVQNKKFDAAAMYRLADSATSSLTVDPGLSGIGPLAKLGQSVSSLPTDRLSFITVPNYPREVDVPSDKANVVWKKSASQKLFTALQEDSEPEGSGSDSAGR
ncbi:LCP family protein [Streptomyces vinaceus]|uniref:LCP family protein n=1 Tax=Streptomyces vinaceus TaxID=1960 RepID=UPI0038104A9A